MSRSLLAPPLPRHVQLEVTGACNLACRMCLVRYRPKLGRRTGAMCFHTFRDVVDALPALEKVTLQGLGEPLLAPDLDRMIEHAARRGIAIGFNTNGTFLTAERSERLIRAGLGWLHVSVDGASAETYESIRAGGDFELVTGHVRALADAKRRLGAERPQLMVVFVAMRRNVHEVPSMVRLVHEWGVDRLWIQQLSHDFGDTDPAGDYRAIREYAREEALGDDPDVHAIFAQAGALAAELGVELRLPLSEAGPRPPRRPGEPGCHWPFEESYVTHDGKVQPCCMVMGADRAVLGTVADGGFAAVWHGAAYRRFRAGLLDGGSPPAVCAGCSLYRRRF